MRNNIRKIIAALLIVGLLFSGVSINTKVFAINDKKEKKIVIVTNETDIQKEYDNEKISKINKKDITKLNNYNSIIVEEGLLEDNTVNNKVKEILNGSGRVLIISNDKQEIK